MSKGVRDPQLLKGVLPMLVLALLSERESYGYELVNRLAADGLSDVATGTIYPLLTRLEREGRITSRLVASSAGPARKYFCATGLGEADLLESARSWRELVVAVAATLDRAARPTPAGADSQAPAPASRSADEPSPAPPVPAPTTADPPVPVRSSSRPQEIA